MPTLLEPMSNKANIAKGRIFWLIAGKWFIMDATGKPIYDSGDHPAHKDFSPKDHSDARKVHMHHAEEGDSNKSEYHTQMGNYHLTKGLGKTLDSIGADSSKAHAAASNHLNQAKAEKDLEKDMKFNPEDDANPDHPESIDPTHSDWHAAHWDHSND